MTIANSRRPRATAEETQMLRALARRKAEILADPVIPERVRLWKKHNALAQERPMLLVSPEGGWKDLIAADDSLRCRCADPILRGIEWETRMEIYMFEHFDTDSVPMPAIRVHKAITDTGWGVEARWKMSEEERGARQFDPVIAGESDLEKLRFPEVSHDEEASRQRFEAASEIFDGILPVDLVGIRYVSFHLFHQWTALHGLEETLIDMLAEPEFTHRAISFLAEGHRRLIEQYEQMGLLDFNFDNTGHSTGGNGWLDSCPGPAPVPGRPVTRSQMWASAEAQELTVVSPAMHEEFALRYEKPLLEPFALTGYGCCEDITDKCDLILSIPHIRRISISPFTNVERTAPRIGKRAIYSWKPRPTDLVGPFQADRIRSYLRENFSECRKAGCNFEVILKDTHTCEGHPERFDDWCRIAREEINAL
jgi:hypothetical protein